MISGPDLFFRSTLWFMVLFVPGLPLFWLTMTLGREGYDCALHDHYCSCRAAIDEHGAEVGDSLIARPGPPDRGVVLVAVQPGSGHDPRRIQALSTSRPHTAGY